MTNKIEKILEDEGWTVECESPLELSNIDGSFASGQGALYLIEGLREENTNYYFVTYQARNVKQIGSYQRWNQCIKDCPMKFLKKLQKAEDKAENSHYADFVILNSCEISQKEYNKYKDEF